MTREGETGESRVVGIAVKAVCGVIEAIVFSIDVALLVIFTVAYMIGLLAEWIMEQIMGRK